jgi:DNA-binding MarR family transcriptional regulator
MGPQPTPSQRRPARDRADVVLALNEVRRLVQALRQSTVQAECETGLSGAQLFVLQQLAQAPAQSLNDLAERTHTHQSSVSVVVTRLVERGLVSRQRSPEDGRRLVLSLTPAGRQLLARAPETVQTKLIRGFDSVPPVALRQFCRVLSQLAAAIGAPAGPPPLLFEPDASETGSRRRRR